MRICCPLVVINGYDRAVSPPLALYVLYYFFLTKKQRSKRNVMIRIRLKCQPGRLTPEASMLVLITQIFNWVSRFPNFPASVLHSKQNNASREKQHVALSCWMWIHNFQSNSKTQTHSLLQVPACFYCFTNKINANTCQVVLV